MSEAKLDTLFTPLFYLAPMSELNVYGGLTLEGKRRFLREFWRQRDPTPGTPENELQAGFYQRLAEANRRFREGGAAEIPGWRTDRGKILILHGEPDEIMRRPSSAQSNPWEAWKYTRPRPTKYVFYDQTRLSNYQLIYTDDRKERSMGGSGYQPRRGARDRQVLTMDHPSVWRMDMKRLDFVGGRGAPGGCGGVWAATAADLRGGPSSLALVPDLMFIDKETTSHSGHHPRQQLIRSPVRCR
jgi:GWxTD domain-containing protein